MTDKTDPIAHAAHLLREAAEEYKSGISLNGVPDWEGEPETAAAYDELMAAAKAIEEWELAIGAGGVEPLRKCLHQIEEPLEKVLARREAVIKLLEQDCAEQALTITNLRGTRKVLWNLLGECLPLLEYDAQETHCGESHDQIVNLIQRINDARTVVQAEELPANSDCHGPDWTDRDGEYLK